MLDKVKDVVNKINRSNKNVEILDTEHGNTYLRPIHDVSTR